jgi:hypothetical protein
MTTYKLIADNFVLYDATGLQLYPVPPPVVIPPPVTGPQPPAPVVGVSPATPNIQQVINNATSGSIVFAAGSYPTLSLRGKSGLTLWADGVVTGLAFDMSGLGGWVVRGKAPGQGFVFTKKLNADNATNKFMVGNCQFKGVPDTGWDGSSIGLNNAALGMIINNDFVGCMGTVLGMYSMDNLTFDGNHFTDCYQPFSSQSTTDGTVGRNLIWQRNVFIGTQRAAIEVGPSSGAAQFYDGLVVDNNWFDDFNLLAQAGTMLPISLVGQAARNTTVSNNFVRKGSRPNSQQWAPAIEFTGTGECKLNTLWGWEVAGYLYQSGWYMHDNRLYLTGGFVNNGSGSGTLGPETILSSAPPVPPQPARIAW